MTRTLNIDIIIPTEYTEDDSIKNDQCNYFKRLIQSVFDQDQNTISGIYILIDEKDSEGSEAIIHYKNIIDQMGFNTCVYYTTLSESEQPGLNNAMKQFNKAILYPTKGDYRWILENDCYLRSKTATRAIWNRINGIGYEPDPSTGTYIKPDVILSFPQDVPQGTENNQLRYYMNRKYLNTIRNFQRLEPGCSSSDKYLIDEEDLIDTTGIIFKNYSSMNQGCLTNLTNMTNLVNMTQNKYLLEFDSYVINHIIESSNVVDICTISWVISEQHPNQVSKDNIKALAASPLLLDQRRKQSGTSDTKYFRKGYLKKITMISIFRKLRILSEFGKDHEEWIQTNQIGQMDQTTGTTGTTKTTKLLRAMVKLERKLEQNPETINQVAKDYLVLYTENPIIEYLLQFDPTPKTEIFKEPTSL